MASSFLRVGRPVNIWANGSPGKSIYPWAVTKTGHGSQLHLRLLGQNCPQILIHTVSNSLLGTSGDLTGFEPSASPVWRFHPKIGRRTLKIIVIITHPRNEVPALTAVSCLYSNRTLVVNSLHEDLDPSVSTAFCRTKQDKNVAETAINCVLREIVELPDESLFMRFTEESLL